jgi:hypothetical protein
MKYVLGLMLVAFPLCGAIMFLAGAGGLWTTWRRRRFLQSAVGKVVAVEERRVANLSHGRRTEPDTAYQPILRFTTATGEVREFLARRPASPGARHRTRSA